MNNDKLSPQPEPPDMPFMQIVLYLILWLINLFRLY
jgi:hypothetical protein